MRRAVDDHIVVVYKALEVPQTVGVDLAAGDLTEVEIHQAVIGREKIYGRGN